MFLNMIISPAIPKDLFSSAAIANPTRIETTDAAHLRSFAVVISDCKDTQLFEIISS
jgi:hypothetical protein